MPSGRKYSKLPFDSSSTTTGFGRIRLPISGQVNINFVNCQIEFELLHFRLVRRASSESLAM